MIDPETMKISDDIERIREISRVNFLGAKPTKSGIFSNNNCA